MTTSVQVEPERTPPRSGRSALVAVGIAAVVRAAAIPTGWWAFHGLAVELETRPESSNAAVVVPVLQTLGICVALSALAVFVAAPVFLTWLTRVRADVDLRPAARQRLAPGWTVGAWLVPLGNYVLPWIVLTDVWRASAPDPTSRPLPVHGWWLAGVAARAAGLAGWVYAIVSLVTEAPQVESTRTIAVLHTAGALLGLVSAGLLALAVVEIDRGRRDDTARRAAAGAPTSPTSPDGPDDPLVPTGATGVVGRVVATMRLGGAHLVLLETITAVTSAIVFVVLSVARTAPTPPTPRLGGPPTVPSGGMAQWLAVLVPTVLVGVVVFMIARSASLALLLRRSAGRPVSPGGALLVGVRRSPYLVGGVVLLLGVFALVAYLAYLIGSIVALVLVAIPTALLLGVVLNLTLVGVVTVEGAFLGRCLGLLRGRFWLAMGRYLVPFPAFFVFSVLADLAYGVGNPVLRFLLLVAVGLPFYVFLSAFTAVVYADLRHRESGGRVLTPQLVEQMDDPQHRLPAES